MTNKKNYDIILKKRVINIKLKDFLKRGDFDKYKIDIKTYNADEEHNCVIIPQLCYCDYVYKLNSDFTFIYIFFYSYTTKKYNIRRIKKIINY